MSAVTDDNLRTLLRLLIRADASPSASYRSGMAAVFGLKPHAAETLLRRFGLDPDKRVRRRAP